MHRLFFVCNWSSLIELGQAPDKEAMQIHIGRCYHLTCTVLVLSKYFLLETYTVNNNLTKIEFIVCYNDKTFFYEISVLWIDFKQLFTSPRFYKQKFYHI
jgi:hypothetical protein